MEKALGLVTGQTGKRLESILSRLEALAKDNEGIGGAIELLKVVERLDDKGTLVRLNELLKQLGPLTKGKTAQALVDRLEKFEKLLQVLLKED